MKLNWSKWGLEFWKSFARHAASAGIAYWAVIEMKHLPFEWSTFGNTMLIGGFVRGALTFLERSPAPEDEDAKKGSNETDNQTGSDGGAGGA
jgi:hypothetical protein